MTHAELVKRACAWLRGSMQCVVVIPELRTWSNNEVPDAIGWTSSGRSVVVECKTTVADFDRDFEKPSRSARLTGMGNSRWYFTVAGLLRAEDMPGSWGLAEVKGRHVRRVRHAGSTSEPDHLSEKRLLVAALQFPTPSSIVCRRGR